jgi:exosome complex exonuclease RRP6
MLYYARSDTHYLLYIYDRVRNDLVEASDRSKPDTDLIGRVLQKSRELSLSRYEHPGYDEESGEGPRGWANYILKHSHLNYNGEQFAIFRAIWKWRDDTARKEDESANFVLGTTHVSEIARVNPPDAKALHSLLPPTAPLARSRLSDLWQYVQAAKVQGGPSLAQFFASIPPESVRRNGLPRIAKALAQLPEVEEGTAANVLSRSQLFGDMPVSTKWEASRNTPGGVDGHFPFPWQRFVQDAPVATETQEQHAANGTADGDDLAAVGKDVAAATLSDSDPEFTLKRGMKRKSEDISEQSSSDQDETSSSEDNEEEEREEEQQEEPVPAVDDAMDDAPDGVISIDEDPSNKPSNKLSNKQRKKQRQAQKEMEEERRLEARAAREARKASKRQQKAREKAERENKYSAVPFDYSQAASVMHASRGANDDDDGEKKEKKKKKQKIFDPYSKSAEEGVKGARRAPPVRGERSATFKK